MTVSVSYLCKNCTTCLFISKSFKEHFFKHFRFESGCKGKAYFWTTKTFWSFFWKSFFSTGRFKTLSSVQYFMITAFLSRLRVQNYCFITYLPNNPATFLIIFRKVFSNSLIHMYVIEHKKRKWFPWQKSPSTLIFIRVRIEHLFITHSYK